MIVQISHSSSHPPLFPRFPRSVELSTTRSFFPPHIPIPCWWRAWIYRALVHSGDAETAVETPHYHVRAHESSGVSDVSDERKHRAPSVPVMHCPPHPPPISPARACSLARSYPRAFLLPLFLCLPNGLNAHFICPFSILVPYVDLPQVINCPTFIRERLADTFNLATVGMAVDAHGCTQRQLTRQQQIPC